MKHLLIFLLFVTACASETEFSYENLDLAGQWNFKIDSLDQGIEQQWFNQEFDETVKLPGSMAENGKGENVTVNTDWTGDIVDQSYFTEEKYERFRQPGNIKIPFWLKPVSYYKGAAWYRKKFDIPENWKEKHVVLFLERCHWESTVFINGKSAGSQNSLSTPHVYDLTGLLNTGPNTISIRIDNRMIIPVGVNSHSVSDHTQSNWNGIAGEINLRATSSVYIDEVQVYPDVEKKVVKTVVHLKNPGKITFKGKLAFRAHSFNSNKNQSLPVKTIEVVTDADQHEVVLNYKIRRPGLWSEHNPVMYKMDVVLKRDTDSLMDRRTVEFGMREFRAKGTRFEVNGNPVFLRGTTECCIFPLTGYPPTDIPSWEKVLQTCKDYGLNHVRFHSFCPPEAAFIAADRLGIYFHVECGSWANQGTSIGDGGILDKFIYEESDRILKEYGNHPSFCMLAYGNEPAGRNQNEFLGKLLTYWKEKDNRRVYTSAAGWPVIPENDYHSSPEPRIQHWGEGLKSIINAAPPQTTYDFRDYISKFTVPVVSHEIGQWCVYPDFREIEKYTGVLKASNFEIFRETLAENHMSDQADDFLSASGKLQTLCYKAEIEAALRTPGFAGFQILQLHDFPGQGTALVGILNPFFESKGYTDPEEFRMFCSETVPLARMEKHVYTNKESFKADIEVAHFGAGPLTNKTITCRIIGPDGVPVHEEIFSGINLAIGNCIQISPVTYDLNGISSARKLSLEVAIENTPFRNRWDFWVYPEPEDQESGNVMVTEVLDKKAEAFLKNGGSVLYLPYGKIGKTKGAQVAIGFSSIFWNTAWTNNQAPHTLGILCDPRHPLMNDFPTEYHSNWQWWDLVSHSQVMIIDDLPAELRPLIQPIDTWFENRRLALAFEANIGKGKLIVCSIDLHNLQDDRLVSKQLLHSFLGYMNSDSFNPLVEVGLETVTALVRE